MKTTDADRLIAHLQANPDGVTAIQLASVTGGFAPDVVTNLRGHLKRRAIQLYCSRSGQGITKLYSLTKHDGWVEPGRTGPTARPDRPAPTGALSGPLVAGDRVKLTQAAADMHRHAIAKRPGSDRGTVVTARHNSRCVTVKRDGLKCTESWSRGHLIRIYDNNTDTDTTNTAGVRTSGVPQAEETEHQA
jgi:hypothetical protein